MFKTAKFIAALSLAVSCTAVAGPPHEDKVHRAQRQINERMTYTPEARGVDYWKVGKRKGDCEDYVLAKREQLIRDGFATEDLEVLLVRLGSGTGHAVLYVRSRDLVLDNAIADPLPLEKFLTGQKAKVICAARDLSVGHKYPVTVRC